MSFATLELVWQDVRRAALGLRRDAALAATVVVTLGLGIGANAAMFNVVDRLMFRPLAYLRDPSSVHRLYWQWQQRGAVSTTTSTYYTRYLDLQRDTSSFALLAAFSERDVAVGDGEFARERRVGAVSASYFDLFEARPVLGRFFSSAEDVTPRGADVAVLGYGFWQTAFAGRSVLGERIHVGNIHATIVGVAPPGFHGVGDGTPAAVFVPITTFAASTGTGDASTYFSRYQWGWINVLARRKPGVSIAQAERDADQAFRQSWQAGSADDPRLPPVDLARPHVVVGSVRPGAGPTPALEARTALWLAGVSGLVLCVAVANVANLLVARALRRRHEIALRLALGVSRPRLYRQALIEGVILALMSAAAAIVAAEWAGGSIRRLLVGAATLSTPVFLDARTLAVTALLAVIAGLLVAVIPVRVSSRSDLSHVLRGGVRGGAGDGRWVRASLLVVQAALSVILLIGAALFVRSQAAVEKMSMGYDATDVLLVNRVIRGGAFDEAAHRALRTSLLAAAQALPQVESAAWVNSVPFGSTSSTTLIVPGIGNTESLASFSYQATTPAYFAVMRTKILRGRGFTTADRGGAPEVAIVSESMARVLWPGQEAIGQCFRMRTVADPCREVVGVAEDMAQRDLTSARYHYYVPIDQYPRTFGLGLLLRVRDNSSATMESTRHALQAVMPGSSYVTVQPLQDLVDGVRRPWRLGATIFTVFGVLALAVAAVGLHGVVAHSVAARRHELGVRVALGAGRLNIVALVVRGSAQLALTGAALGMLTAAVSGRWIQPLLFQQSAIDLRVYAVTIAVLLLVTLLASAMPAWRALQADPTEALRGDS